MNDKELFIKACGKSTLNIIQQLKFFVRDAGQDVTDYDRETFGLDVEEDEQHTVTKVLNFYDNKGCYFYEPDKVNDDGLRDMTEKNYLSRLYEHAVFTAYQCLYIVKNSETDEEELHYYRFTNGGTAFDDDQAEPDHGNVETLSLLDLHYITEAINQNF